MNERKEQVTSISLRKVGWGNPALSLPKPGSTIMEAYKWRANLSTSLSKHEPTR